jgi:7-keto-8-aminopelargonate synthetase-like enzyme
MESAAGTETIINGNKYLYFAGTGYFQLNTNKKLLEAASRAILKYGTGSATSRSITGTTPLILELEKKAAEYFGAEDAAYLPSGYLSNIAGMAALKEMELFDIVFIDEDSHYCHYEGAMLTGKSIIKFKNRDVEDLRSKLEENIKNGEKPLIASDGLFPIMAKPAPLVEYHELVEKYNGVIWIDDAHGVGIIGEKGRGTYEYLGLKSGRLYMGATLSKAFGAYGGIIPGRAEFVKHIKTGNVITGSSSPMNAAVAAGIIGLELVKNHPEMRIKLWENAAYLKKGLKTLGIVSDNNCLPVVSFVSGDTDSMKKIHKALMDEGIYIQYADYRGAGNDGVLRIVVFSTHTKKQIDFLIEKLQKVLS